MSDNKIVMYSMPTWPACVELKRFLSEKNIEFEVKNVQADKEAKKELLTVYKSRSVPTTIVNGEMIVGFDEGRFLSVLGMLGS